MREWRRFIARDQKPGGSRWRNHVTREELDERVRETNDLLRKVLSRVIAEEMQKDVGSRQAPAGLQRLCSSPKPLTSGIINRMYEIANLEPKYTVQSLVRALNLLNVISDDSSQDGMALTELAKIVGMSKGSVFSSLQTLAAFGIVSDHGSGHGRRYRLGLGLIRLGNRAAAQITIAEVARPHLEALSADTGLTSRLAMIQGNWAVAVARVDAPGSIQLNLGLGEREWPHRSALGKALLLGSRNDNIASILEHTGMAGQTSHTIATLQDFLVNIEHSRARGYALDDEEDRDGIMCVAVPVHNQAGDTLAAMGVTGLKAGPEFRDLSSVARALMTRSQALSEELSASQ